MTLNRTEVLTKSKDFNYVFSSPKKVYGHYLIIFFRLTNRNRPRLGLAVLKKHTRTSVRRNVVRRIIKESFRAVSNQLDSLDIIVLSKPSIIDIDRKVLRKTIDEQWQTVIKKCVAH